MNDFIGKLIGIFLAFTILVIGPTINNATAEEQVTNKSLINEQVNFINKVCDSGMTNEQMISDFYIGVASKGIVADIKIKRYIKVVNPDGKGGTVVSYIPSEKIDKFNPGDIVKIQVKALGWSGPQKLMASILGFFSPKYDQELAGMIRK